MTVTPLQFVCSGKSLCFAGRLLEHEHCSGEKKTALDVFYAARLRRPLSHDAPEQYAYDFFVSFFVLKFRNSFTIGNAIPIHYIHHRWCIYYIDPRRSFAAHTSGGPENSWSMSTWATAIMEAIVEPKRSSIPRVTGLSKILRDR